MLPKVLPTNLSQTIVDQNILPAAVVPIVHVPPKVKVSFKCTCGTIVPDVNKAGVNTCREGSCQFD